MRTWKRFLLESKTVGMSIDEVLELIENYGNNTWVFFDTETTGFHPDNDQITEIAAIAVTPNGWQEKAEIVSTFHEKIRLNDDVRARMSDPDSVERQEWDARQKGVYKPLKDPADVLRMTQYGTHDKKYIDEQEALNKFEQWIESQNNPMLIAQNATFDMKFVNVRKEMPLKRYPVLDTVPLLQYHVVPVLRTIRDGDFQEYDPRFDPRQRLRAKEILKQLKVKNYYSTSLGKVAPALDIKADNWHSALADTQMLVNLFNKIHTILVYAQQRKLNVDPEQRAAINFKRSRDKWFASKRRKK